MKGLVKRDAHEFGLHVRQGGWRLGLLVARCVEKGAGGRGRREGIPTGIPGKVTAQEFARMSGTTAARVLRYLEAWNRAAEAGHIPAAATLTPDSEPNLYVDKLPSWGDFYDASNAGGRPRDGKPDDALVIIERQSPEERGRLVTQLLTDTDTRAAVVEQPRGAAAVESMHHTIRAREVPVIHTNLPPQPEFAPAFWRAVSVVHTAYAELQRWGVRDLDADPTTRDAAERLRTQAAEVGHAVADYVVDNIST